MATPIDIERVTAVLLHDGWHYIQPGTFSVGDYSFNSVDETVGRSHPAFFFSKIDQISRELQHFTGPIGSLIAFRYAIPTEIVELGEAGDDDQVF